MNRYPKAIDEQMVGEYSAFSKAGGGYVWDEVLEYRVWCHPGTSAKDLENGDDYYYAFSSYEKAKAFSDKNNGVEEPIVLVLQKEYIDEPEMDKFNHVKEERMAEWQVEWLRGS